MTPRIRNAASWQHSGTYLEWFANNAYPSRPGRRTRTSKGLVLKYYYISECIELSFCVKVPTFFLTPCGFMTPT
ncbi:hypothetical protein AcW1_009152 [Taiwanofungus camphoratus]|nr:hypothetical protein AcW1_009152 [Antrodia cinnamomea]